MGNYGDDFASCKLGLSLAGRIKCSNFVGAPLSEPSPGLPGASHRPHWQAGEAGSGHHEHPLRPGGRPDGDPGVLRLARGASLEALRAVAACITTEAALE